jgi:hypothetical protein
MRISFVLSMAPLVHFRHAKEMSRMNDPSTYWLTITNVGLGVVTLVCCGAVAVGIVQELAAKRRKAASLSKLDSEVADLVSSFGDGHAFHIPNLGVTMADGGEEIGGKDRQ